MRKNVAAPSHLLILAVLLSVQVALAQELSIRVFPDREVYVVGRDTLTMYGSCENKGEDVSVDVHVALITPDGLILEAPDWNADFRPTFSNIFLPSGLHIPETEIGSHQVGDIRFPTVAPGDYLLAAALTSPGTLELMCEINFAPFTVEAPAVPQIGTILCDGLERRLMFYVPKGLPSTPVPLVFMLHGAGCDAEMAIRLTQGRFNELADRDKVIVIYPEGINARWNNCYQDAGRIMPDDVQFISTLIDEFSSAFSIDAERVYSAGHSNGGMMSLRLATELSDRIAAVASCAGPSPVDSECSDPVNPLGILYIAGTADDIVPFYGSSYVMSADDTVDFWRGFLDTDAEPSITDIPDTVPDDNSTVRIYRYNNGLEGSRVWFYRIEGGSHGWPAPPSEEPSISMGGNQDISACDEIWSFFGLHTLSGSAN
ncbi:MAG: hypothetical protein JW941_02810 [Candidatus Coatesbacteria bacterium]|nr:hypothetical protein [Candidatus Coatesbacteria bacterium]